jgi:orotate phosphoribosyltransferase
LAIVSEIHEVEAAVLGAIRAKALLRDREYVLASGKTSNYFLNMKAVLTDGSDTLSKIADLMLHRFPEDVSAVGGLATGAIPISAEIVSRNNTARPDRLLHFFWVLPDEKTHGLGGLVSGTLFSGDRVVIVDDVTTEGNSVMKAVRAVVATGAKVLKVITVVDRERGAADKLRSQGLKFEALFTSSQILQA